jgi:tetratricopeptide (TPR) repeat protein
MNRKERRIQAKAAKKAGRRINQHGVLGEKLVRQGRIDEAISAFQKAVSKDQKYVNGHYNLGVLYQDQGRLDDAIDAYRHAIAINPDHFESQSNCAILFKGLERQNEAVACYLKALAIKPDYTDGYNDLGVLLKELGKPDEAMASYHKALAIKPDFAEAHYNLGNALNELGRLDKAVANYQKALAIKPDFALAWNNLNLSTRALQFLKSSGDHTAKVSENGLNDAARTTVGYVIHQYYLARFRPHEADESFEKIISVLPSKNEQTIPTGGAERQESMARLPDKIVGLLYFGRSGTGLLHSLVDGHPKISTLPSVYLRGYFNEGVWDNISARGWRGLPERFADEFAVLFDARSSKPIPSRLGESPFSIGEKEGMTSVGENRDEFLSLDRKMFCDTALRLMEGMKSINPMSFLMVIHAAFEEVCKSNGESGPNKSLCFYHIHNPDEYAMPNFLRYAPHAWLLMTVRDPLLNCESLLRISFKEKDDNKGMLSILGILFEIDQIPFRMRKSVGIRLEDLKSRPEATIQALCTWLGVENTPSLNEMTAQGKKWWGDPSSPNYAHDKAMSPFDVTMVQQPVGSILSEKDQLVLGTLFYPFSVRFGYREPNTEQFQKDLKEIRPLLNDILDFEKTMAERSNINYGQFKKKGTYQLFHAGLVDRWDVLDELGDYPYMLEPLSIS